MRPVTVSRTFTVFNVFTEVEKTPTLDDLFKKTRAKPQIYYLPLTSQQVAEKLANRSQASLTKPGVKA